MEVSNDPRRALKIPRRYQIFHGGGQTFHGGMKYSTEISNIPRRYKIFHGRGQIFHRHIKYSKGGGVKQSKVV